MRQADLDFRSNNASGLSLLVLGRVIQQVDDSGELNIASQSVQQERHSVYDQAIILKRVPHIVWNY